MTHDCKYVRIKLDPQNIAQTEDDEFQKLIEEVLACETCTKWASKTYDPDEEHREILRMAYQRIRRA